MSEADRPIVDLGEGTVMSLAGAAIEMSGRGDHAGAVDHLERARAASRVRARRERQVVEIAAAIIEGAIARAVGLAVEHRHDFPDDAPLLEELLSGRSGSGGAW